MAIGLIQEFEGDLAQYDEVTAKLDLDANPPDGLIIHTAGSIGGNRVRVFDVWKTDEAWERFRDERLLPAIEAVTRGEPYEATTEAYALHDLFPG
jgi:hypothetical protein